MKVLHAIPAYGRDYKNQKEVKADWEAGKDFVLTDISSPWDGKPVNLQDAKEAGFTHANLRFKRLASICVVTIK